MLAELEKQIEKEKINYESKKKVIEKKLCQMPISLEGSKGGQDLSRGLIESQSGFEELKMHSKTIERSVAEIANVSESALRNFETLKYRKQNIESILSTMISFIEQRRILPLLKQCAETKNVEEAAKHMKNYKTFSANLIQGFNHGDQRNQKEIFTAVGEMAKNEFEEALRKNDTVRLHKCTELSEQLGLCDNSLERVSRVYVDELTGQLSIYEKQWIKTVEGTFRTNNSDVSQYGFPFSEAFIGILQRLVSSFTSFKDNIYTFYGLDGLLQTLKRIIDESVLKSIEILFKKLYQYYELDHITGFNLSNKNTNGSNNQQLYLNSKGEAARVDMLCEEASSISNQNEHFSHHVLSLIVQLIQTEPIKEQHKAEKSHLARSQIEQLQINNKVLDVMAIFLRLQKAITKQQIATVARDSPSFARLWNFDKQFMQPFLESEEQLFNIQKLHEYLDEIFYAMETGSIRALESLSRPTACAVLNFISSQAIHEDLYFIQDSLLNKFLKRENFNSQSISFSSKNTIHNSFIIVLFNNIQMVSKLFIHSCSFFTNKKLKGYIKKLKQKLFGNIEQLYSIEERNMLIASVDEIEDQNDMRFKQFSESKMDILIELLKNNIKQYLEDIKNVNFTMNEVQQEEYERGSTYSIEIKQRFTQYLQQWKFQFTKENYELFTLSLCKSISNTLEKIITENKRYHLMGAFLLDKEVRNIIAFFQNTTLANIKPCFQKLQMICEILKLENNTELQEFWALGTGELSKEEIKRIIRLRSDFK